MESELIIDGQVIALSEKQESAEEVTTEQQDQLEKKDQAETEKEVSTESEQAEEQPDEYSLRIGDEEIQLTEEDDDHVDGQPAPQWVKDLRKNNREKIKSYGNCAESLSKLNPSQPSSNHCSK